MPRMSKSERQLMMENQSREDQRRVWDAFLDSYPRRILNLVYEYSRHDELSVKKDSDRDQFVFSRPQYMNDKWFPLELRNSEPNPEFIYAFEEAEQALQSILEAEQEAERRYQLRQWALSKLSAEERAALNL